MSNFWKNFTYCVKIRVFNPKSGSEELKTAYVTEVDDDHKTFKWKTEEELNGNIDEIMVFHLSKAVDLMNSLTCNGYQAAIQPMFKN